MTSASECRDAPARLAAEDVRPRASVVIPTKGRPRELCSLLGSLRGQLDVAEVIVLLDGADPATEELVRSRFPEVRVLPSEHSHGPLFQRNRGARLAACEFVVFLDDDIVLQSPETVRQTLELFDSPEIGAVTIPFFNSGETGQVVCSAAPDGDRVQYTSTFYAGMVAFRTQAYLAVGGYRERLFMHVEESDIAVRMMNEGFFIRLGSAEPLLHQHSSIRDNERLHYLGARNHILFAMFCIPMPYLVAHLPLTVLNTLRHGVRIKRIGTVTRGLLAGLGESLAHLDERRPVSPRTYRLSRKLRGQPGGGPTVPAATGA